MIALSMAQLSKTKETLESSPVKRAAICCVFLLSTHQFQIDGYFFLQTQRKAQFCTRVIRCGQSYNPSLIFQALPAPNKRFVIQDQK